MRIWVRVMRIMRVVCVVMVVHYMLSPLPPTVKIQSAESADYSSTSPFSSSGLGVLRPTVSCKVSLCHVCLVAPLILEGRA